MDLERTQVQSPADRVKAQDLSLRRTQPPAKVPGYDPERLLGEGAYGEVWVATERNTGRKVAVKFYTHRGGLDWSLLKREVEKLAFLSADRYVIQLIEVGWDSDPPYYVMEYLGHGSLEERLSEQGALPLDEAISLFREVATGLMHAHGKGVLHCDLKPGNVLLDQDSRPRLCDFGQARLSDEQTPSLGTLFYMAPEQANLRQALPDARWDVYALGALFYCMLTGEPPYRTEENIRRLEAANTLEERLAVYRQTIESSPRPTEHRKVPGVNRFLADIIDRCLAVQPSRRYSNIQAVLNDLEEWQRRKARRPVLLLATLLPAIVILVGGYFAYRGFRGAMALSEQALMRRTRELHELAATYAAPAVTEKIHTRWNRLSREAAYFSDASDEPPGGPKGKPNGNEKTGIAEDGTSADAAKSGEKSFREKCWDGFRQVMPREEPKAAEYNLETLKKAMQWAKDDLAGSYRGDPAASEKIEQRLRREPQHLLRYADEIKKRDGSIAGERVTEVIDNWLAIQQWLAHARQSRNGDLSSTSWLVMNDHGDQIARDPIDVDTVFENWGWREYFHGQDEEGDVPKARAKEMTPTTSPHLTRRPFKSAATNQPMVAFSVPIQMRVKVQGNERIVIAGVLAMTVEFGEFSELQHENKDIFASLVYAPPLGKGPASGPRGALLEHPFFRLLRSGEKKVPNLFVDNELLSQIDDLMQETPYRAKILEEYQDPVEQEVVGASHDDAHHDFQGPWLAAMYPVVVDRKPTDWVVIVQEKISDAQKPLDDLRRQLLAQAVVAAIAVILAVIAAWAFAALMLHGHTRSKFVNALRRRMGLTGGRSTSGGTASGGRTSRTARRPGKTPTSKSTGR
jgi:serine/threonine protein kinase